MTVWRTTGGEGGPDPGAREAPRYDIVEHDSALLRITAASGAPRVLLAGEVDVSNTAEVARALRAVQERASGDLHADLAGVEFMDVAGLRAFSEAARALHDRGGLLVLHGVPLHIERLFTLIGWHTTPGLEIHCPPPR
ncbi:STAS domain-containing protein [Actinomadura mexicana]|uniref:Anti-anti-sigma factor n=1 Tax=Actinomadura mexicana TaxID=134959 RepID=A0A238UYN4_9ACTN|nr:STAS domain-containing protein [Actinomadura mexicana]SNR26413.1 anti-anti-sigma factor [Actinomadura mexicana]